MMADDSGSSGDRCVGREKGLRDTLQRRTLDSRAVNFSMTDQEELWDPSENLIVPVYTVTA